MNDIAKSSHVMTAVPEKIASFPGALRDSLMNNLRIAYRDGYVQSLLDFGRRSQISVDTRRCVEFIEKLPHSLIWFAILLAFARPPTANALVFAFVVVFVQLDDVVCEREARFNDSARDCLVF